ncbi:MAG TPA: hypothetical protein VK014_06130 [Cyclobacteriaceae bacterium]|nr:hypothetical protein [Cyclobacteriaceae bacterium]
MDIKAINQVLKEQGRVSLKEGGGHRFALITPEQWDEQHDQATGIFLLYDLFQIRSIAVPFSDVSLDVVEFGNKPIIYHTLANKTFVVGPFQDGQVKFAMIREGGWNKLLFNHGKLLIYEALPADRSVDFEVPDKFPLSGKEVKEMFLGPEGEVKILS